MLYFSFILKIRIHISVNKKGTHNVIWNPFHIFVVKKNDEYVTIPSSSLTFLGM